MKYLILGLIAFCAAGCARFPASIGPGTGTRLSFSLTVDREINRNYVYIVAIRLSKELNPTTGGPVAVIAPPWGNGFVGGNCTHFVRWDPLTSPTYTLYAFRDANLLQFFSLGSPVNFTDPLSGGNKLQFDIDLKQIAGTDDPASFQSIQVNFLTMDNVPQGSSGGSKVWDALGDANLASEINDWITIPLNVTATYNNTRFAGLEPRGDCADPDLDLVDFQVDVHL